MLLIPLHTQILKPGDDLIAILAKVGEFRDRDIFVISSKAVATVEGRVFPLSEYTPSQDARRWARKTGQGPEFLEVVLREMRFRRGKVVGHCLGALLTELRPRGLRQGVILTANAGVDESNAPKGYAVGWSEDPVGSVRKLREGLECHAAVRGPEREVRAERASKHNKQFAVILSDSCCHPRRWGVTAQALTVSGLDPLRSEIGSEDLFRRKLRMTREAVADQLAVAGNFLMGNAGQGIPAVIIRDHGLSLSGFEGWVPGIEKKDDLFRKFCSHFSFP